MAPGRDGPVVPAGPALKYSVAGALARNVAVDKCSPPACIQLNNAKWLVT
jgi:hypothetical protein